MNAAGWPAAHPEAGSRSPGRGGLKGRMRAALVITIAVLAVEIAGGIASHSLALIADAAHLFADLASLALAYAAMTVAERAPTGRHTFGLYRAEILAAFVNAQVLLVMGIGILVEAASRLASPVRVHTGLMLGVASFALAANFATMRLLSHGHAHRDSLNIRAAYLEVVTDMLGSAAVLAAAFLIPRTGWLWLDAAVSALVAVAILPRAVSLLRQSAHILLEGAPGDINAGIVRKGILAIRGIEAIHDLHFWTLTSGVHSATVHIRARADADRSEVLAAVQRVLKDEAGVDHATIQLEWGSEMTCHASNRGHA
ncbi:MAG TPA: cation diffusion facilitator family transporter [Thermoanaerobaculia bacterium]